MVGLIAQQIHQVAQGQQRAPQHIGSDTAIAQRTITQQGHLEFARLLFQITIQTCDGAYLARRADDQYTVHAEGGRIVYFEGTYTAEFSGNPVKTPRYDYNQLLYRLDLSHPALKAAMP